MVTSIHDTIWAMEAQEPCKEWRVNEKTHLTLTKPLLSSELTLIRKLVLILHPYTSKADILQAISYPIYRDRTLKH